MPTNPPPTRPERTWTFFGHWDDGDELVIDHAVEGCHIDVYEDPVLYSGGLWCDSGTGTTIAEAEADARARTLPSVASITPAAAPAPDVTAPA